MSSTFSPVGLRLALRFAFLVLNALNLNSVCKFDQIHYETLKLMYLNIISVSLCLDLDFAKLGKTYSLVITIFLF